MRIGLVDDDLAVRRGLTRLIEACGHRIEAYASASEFLQEATLDGFDCLLLDVRMPELTGFDLFERLARRGCLVPIIFITGHGDAALGQYAVRRGSIAVLAKPIDEETLLAAIDDAVEKAASDRRRPPTLVPSKPSL
jgi:FixJ family two-component response regulator